VRHFVYPQDPLLPFFLRCPKRLTCPPTTLEFSFSRPGPWRPKVSPNLQFRIVLVIDIVSLFLTVSIADIDDEITLVQNSLSLYPHSHFSHVLCVQTLIKSRLERYTLSQQKEDLSKSIVHCTEAILLPHVSRDGHHLENAFQLLLYLAYALLARSETFKQPEDIKYSIEYLRYLRGISPDSFDIPINDVTTSLIHALSIQVELEAGDGTPNIKEMVVLCRELLTSNVSADFPIGTFQFLDQAVNVEYNRGRPIRLLDQVIECLRDAVKVCPPDSYDLSIALANQLYNRFTDTHSNGDYEEATALLEGILDPNQPGECPDSTRDIASSLATVFALCRSIVFKNPESYSEVTTSRLRTLLSSSSVDEGLRLKITNIMAMQIRQRFAHYSLTENLEEANSYDLQVIDLSSSESMEKSSQLFLESDAVRNSYSMTRMAEKIQHLEELLSITPPGTYHHKECLRHLERWYRSKFHRTNDISDIEESIKYSRLSLDATDSSDTWRMNPLASLRNTLNLAFQQTRKISYLDESITVGYDILKLRSAQHVYFHATRTLVESLITREKLLGRREDRHEAIRLISMVIDNQYAREPDRFRLSCQWAILARSVGHPATLTAYKSAMSLMQKSLSFAPTVSVQHARLVTMGESCQTMPLDYASYQIRLGRFEEAVETLEQGRGLLWSEMRGLRTPVAQLIEEDSPLATRFAEINQELEALTISITPSGKPEMEDSFAQGGDGMDPFGRLVVKRRKLVEERDVLISQIQGQPGLQGILKALPFTTLRSAASRGPVVIINHCRWRSDIIILFHNSLPCTIPTADDFFARAHRLRDELVEARKPEHGLDSREYQDALCSVLKGLYELVGEPVIKRLRMLGVPEQSRIWWCPTSVFCSLPLHAMGPIQLASSDTSKQYFSDLYIPSYTPSLSALIESRKTSPQTPVRPSLLLVAQPEDSLPGVKGEIKVIRRLEEWVTVASLVSSEATPTSVVEGLRGSRFAHFACHGVLEAGKPFDASFKLHGGSRLTLLDIVRSRLPDAEFAFLSCCHAAEITEESLADEALHLTAAMQYCGFRSVVGTMWEMADTDGRDLAKSFYESLFSSQEAGVPYYERSAHALRDATRKLRRKRGITLERWVNFVHYGA
jgi:tetratricopeptide (TPR) repeat protein